jgi:hypothetical protein
MLSFRPAPNEINPDPYTFPLSKHDLLDHLADLLDAKIIDGIGFAKVSFDDENNIILKTTPASEHVPCTTYKISVQKMRKKSSQ